MTSPRIYLAIDNCFASKRWAAPDDWARIIHDLGLNCVEASADNDCDPFHLPADAMTDWLTAVREAEQRHVVRVVNLYSGHGTYVTLGLTHTDARVRAHFRDDWLKPMTRIAAELGAGMGFYCHAISQPVLADPARYAELEASLVNDLAALARYGVEVGAGLLGLEQMRSPHLPPWTIAGSTELLRRIYRAAGVPFYLTVDVTHASGQSLCYRPTIDMLTAAVAAAREGAEPLDLWLGPETMDDLFDALVRGVAAPQEAAAALDAQLADYPHMFAEPRDSTPYAWLTALGPYSPIIHLSQSTGHDAAHSPFTAEHNATGVIKPRRVLEALAAGYAAPASAGLPPRCETLYLTLEIFPLSMDPPNKIMRELRESVALWRQYIPRDGLLLSELLA